MPAMPIALVPNAAAPHAPPPKAADAKSGEHDFGFGDLLDIVNPLQHIPVVSTLYRELTGDKMGPTAEIVGGTLFGGIVGAVSSVADVLFTQETGKDFGQTVMSWLGLDGQSPTQVAAAIAPAQANAAYRSAIVLQDSALDE